VAKDSNGVLYAASSGHRLGHVCPFGKDLLYISRDDGESWLGPIIANDSYLDDRDAGLVAWGDGNLLLSWFSHPAESMDAREEKNPTVMLPLSLGARQMWKELPKEELVCGSFVKCSHDGGKTWGEKVRVPVSAPHGPIRRGDGSFLYFGRCFHGGSFGLEQNGIYALESRDEGKTWQTLGKVPALEGVNPVRVCEPYAVELADGTILGAMRINRETKEEDNGICTTVSRDGGKTWSEPRLIGAYGAPPHFLLHSSGVLILTYGRRTAPYGQRARLSYDGGETWGEDFAVSQEAPDWDLGYPSSVELSDGSILTVYYQKYPGDSYPSLLGTRWELPGEKSSGGEASK